MNCCIEKKNQNRLFLLGPRSVEYYLALNQDELYYFYEDLE